ncbi:MAG TPA: NAD-dependent deacylase [Vicinamibacterales bacterium]
MAHPSPIDGVEVGLTPEDEVSMPLDAIARRFAPDARITVLTGAGISAASGVPTFRGAEGLWKQFRLVWEWYDWRRQLIAACRPNAGHDVLAAWSARFPNFTLITQNVDGLHERAGSRGVLRMHGSIWEVACWSGCDGSPARWIHDGVPLSEIPPHCRYCGGWIRPGVVWFGEALDPEIVTRCLEATTCDVFLTVGTSAVVYPAASLIEEARKRGAYTVEINLEPTPASNVVDIAVQGSAEHTLAEIDRRLGQA